MNLRPLTPDDAEAYVALRRAMLLDAPHAFLSSPEDDRGSKVEEVRERLASEGDDVTYGVFAQELCGAVGLHRERHEKAAHKVLVWGMYVAPKRRQEGLGRQLLEAVVAHARGLDGVSQLCLSVSEAAPEARRLYEAVGFHVWGPSRGPCASKAGCWTRFTS